MDSEPVFKATHSEALQERIERDGEAALTEAERVFLLVEEFDLQLFASGFEEYFLRASQEKISLLLDALTAIGAARSRELTAAAADALSGWTRHDRDQVPDLHLTPRGKLCETFIRQLQEYPDHLLKLREAYAAEHEKEFLGPKTQLELWRSRRKRGASTAPKRVTVILSAEAELKRDASIATRNCPECDYPSPDYRRTCKACGFPHGARE